MSFCAYQFKYLFYNLIVITNFYELSNFVVKYSKNALYYEFDTYLISWIIILLEEHGKIV